MSTQTALITVLIGVTMVPRIAATPVAPASDVVLQSAVADKRRQAAFVTRDDASPHTKGIDNRQVVDRDVNVAETYISELTCGATYTHIRASASILMRLEDSCYGLAA